VGFCAEMRQHPMNPHFLRDPNCAITILEECGHYALIAECDACGAGKQASHMQSTTSPASALWVVGRGFSARNPALPTPALRFRFLALGLDYRTLIDFPLSIRPTSSPFGFDRAITGVHKCPATFISGLFMDGWPTIQELSVHPFQKH